MAGKSAKSQLVLLLVFLGIVGGAGAWNYQRNTKAEEQEYRPFRSYAESDLETLKAAYEEQLGTRTDRYRAVAAQNVAVKGNGLVGDQVREFERVQQVSRKKRALAGNVAETQVSLEQIKEELSRRKRDRPVYKMYLRRIFTYQP